MNNECLTYKGYLGSIEYSIEDNILFGKVIGVNSLLTYEAETIRDLVSEFHNTVDEYLDFCKEQGIKAEKTYSGTLSIRISPKTHSLIAQKAMLNGITINKFISKTLDDAVV